MNKVVKVWIYAIISILSIVGLIFALTLIPKDDENDRDDETDDTPTEVYATDFQLNIPTNIEIPVGQSVEFLDGFISVSPLSMLNQLTYETNTTSGLTLANNVLTGHEVGSYTLKFKMPKSKSTYFVKTISVVVSNNYNNAHAKLINNSIEKDKTYNINQLFEIKDGSSFYVEADNKLSLNENELSALNVGASQVELTFIEGCLKYLYSFSIIIKEQPEYKINLNNVTNNLIVIDMLENDVFLINYEIKDKNNQHVNQQVLAESSNEEIVVIEKIYDDSIIKVRGLKEGNASITIFVLNNLSISIEINIIVE